MRDIKFEYIFFDLINKKYIKKVFEIKDLEFMNFEIFMLENSNFKFIARRQYTGMLDKNGIEIYEGDIVKAGNGNIFKIVFFDGCFMVAKPQDRIKIVMNLRMIVMDKDCEVIGNIYQNKELL